MIKVKIGPIEKDLGNADANWIHKMIKSLRDDGKVVCIIVTIEEPPINITLSTSECGRRGSGIDNFNEKEKRIIELWQKHLGKDKVVPEQLNAFLSQLGKFVS